MKRIYFIGTMVLSMRMIGQRLKAKRQKMEKSYEKENFDFNNSYLYISVRV